MCMSGYLILSSGKAHDGVHPDVANDTGVIP